MLQCYIRSSELASEGLDQSLALEHALLDFSDDIPPIVLPNKNIASSPPSHPASTTQPMYEVNSRMRHIVKNDMSHSQRVNAP